MPKTIVELLVNDEPQEFLAQPGTTLLSALRGALRALAGNRGGTRVAAGQEIRARLEAARSWQAARRG